MDRRKRNISIAVSVVCLVGLLWFWQDRIEPAHNGKTLTEWLQIGRSDPSRKSEAQEAVQVMGEPVLAHLQRRLLSKRFRFRLRLGSIAHQVGLRSLVFPPRPNVELEEAIFGFQALGEQSVPTLRKLLKNADQSVRHSAMLCLDRIGPRAAPAVPELSNILRSRREALHRAKAAETLGLIGSSREITDLLASALSDEDAKVRLYAALALGRFDKVAVTRKDFNVTMELIWNGRFDGREIASLGNIDAAATNAIPALERTLADPNQSVRTAARFALEQIRAASTNWASP